MSSGIGGSHNGNGNLLPAVPPSDWLRQWLHLALTTEQHQRELPDQRPTFFLLEGKSMLYSIAIEWGRDNLKTPHNDVRPNPPRFMVSLSADTRMLRELFKHLVLLSVTSKLPPSTAKGTTHGTLGNQFKGTVCNISGDRIAHQLAHAARVK